MIIEIKGVQFVNKGAELMLVAIQQKLAAELSDNYTLALSPRNSPFEKRSAYGAYQKIGNLYKRIDWSTLDFLIPKVICNNYGLVKHNDIDVVLDASGFSYGEQWRTDQLSHSVKQAKKMKKLGKKYIFMPQAMGPFKSVKYKALIKEAVDNCTFMFIRDKLSYEFVTSIVGEKSHVILSPDFTNLVYLDEDLSGLVQKEKLVTLIPNNKMQSKQNTTDFNGRNYVGELVTAGKFLQSKGYHVAVLNHEGKNDFDICKKIFSELDSAHATLLNDLGPTSIKKQIGISSLVICSRFHGCVSALSQDTPVIGTSWSHKYGMLYSDYDSSKLLYKFDEPLISLVEDTILNINEIKENIGKYSQIEKEKTKLMWRSIFTDLIVNTCR